MNHSRCPYCRAIVGTEPAERVYEDDLVVAFLEPAPINPGHTVLVPRDHIGGISAVPAALLAHLMGIAPRLAQVITRSVDGDGFNIFVSSRGCAGQDVLHAAVHLVPRHGTDGFSFGWRSRPYADAAAALLVGDAIRGQLAVRGLEPGSEYDSAAVGEAEEDGDVADAEEADGNAG